LKNIIILCQSYRQLINTLSVIEKEKNESNVIVYVLNHKNLYKALCDISKTIYKNKIKIKFIARYQSKTSSLSFKLFEIVKEKAFLTNQFNEYFKNTKNSIIYFSSRHFSDYGFFIINRLAKNNKIIYIPSPDADLLPLKKKVLLKPKQLFKLLSLKLTFGYNIKAGEYISHFFPFIDDRFLKKKVDKIFTFQERDKMINQLNINKFKIWNKNTYDVIYFGHNALNIRLSKVSFENILNQIFNELCKNFEEKKIASKYHPGRKNDTIINKGIIIDDYVPSELINTNKTKLYISIYSSSLATVENGFAISLIDLIPNKDPKHKEEVKKRLIDMSKVEIKFPTNIEEFKFILSKVISKD
tara:strand:+ start:18162 stop:19232 length:1071 start_codon:yes stop_codon:yes gene_type:complete